jgi:hypothetical protein
MVVNENALLQKVREATSPQAGARQAKPLDVSIGKATLAAFDQ